MTEFMADKDRLNFSVPSGGQWFWRQAPMLEAYSQSGGVPIAWDKPDGKKIYGLYSDKMEVMKNIMQNPTDKRWGYEMIPVNTPCLAYADIELVCIDPDPERRVLSSIISVIREHVRKAFKRTGEFYIAEGSRLRDDGMFKISCHLVIADIIFECNHDGKMKNLFSISDPALYHTGPDGKSKYCIDLSVYTKNRLFRLPNCCKLSGAQIPLVRINADPMDDDFTDRDFEIEDILPFFVANPPLDEDAVFVRTDSVPAPSCADVFQQPAKRARTVEYDLKPLPFPIRIIQDLLRDAGDRVSSPTKVVYREDEGQWQIQCNQNKQQRKCLVNPVETHISNNCIVFVSKHLGQFKCKVHCTASTCCSMQKYVMGHVSMGPDLEWQFGAYDDVVVESSDIASQGSHAMQLDTVSLPDDTPCSSAVQTPSLVAPFDHLDRPRSKLPQDNTYDIVKRRHEELCFKVLSPSVYAVLLPGRYEPDLMGAVQLKQHFANVYYYELGKKMMWEKKLFIDAWIADEDRRQVTEIVVDPMCTRKDVYNMWKPFAVTFIPPVCDNEVEDLVQPILKHISDVIAVGNDHHLNWIIDYLANMVQRPDRKSQVAVLLYGVEGCGKGIIFEFFRRCILGEFCSFQTSDPENDLFGRFANGAFHRVLIQVDEVKTLHDHSCRLKDFITNNTINYERKGKDKITVQNISNLILTSNNENALAVSPEDRRFSLFRCSSIHKMDKSYFIRLAEHLAKPKVARAFYQYLMSRDLAQYVGDFQASRPITEYYKETQLANISPVMRFLSWIVNDESGPVDIAAKKLYEDYQNFHHSGNYKFIMSYASFGREVKRIVGIKTKRITSGIVYQLDKRKMKSSLIESNRYDPDA
jgi:Family of unknown function (DUF5906)